MGVGLGGVHTEGRRGPGEREGGRGLTASNASRISASDQQAMLAMYCCMRQLTHSSYKSGLVGEPAMHLGVKEPTTELIIRHDTSRRKGGGCGWGGVGGWVGGGRGYSRGAEGRGKGGLTAFNASRRSQ